MNEIEADYAAVLEKYGPDFGNSQGWAPKHLEKRDPNIADIQGAAGIDHLAPYYRMASHNVHANPNGVFFKLGLIDEASTMLAGPSCVFRSNVITDSGGRCKVDPERATAGAMS